jgi:hypothetical protein
MNVSVATLKTKQRGVMGVKGQARLSLRLACALQTSSSLSGCCRDW